MDHHNRLLTIRRDVLGAEETDRLRNELLKIYKKDLSNFDEQMKFDKKMQILWKKLNRAIKNEQRKSSIRRLMQTGIKSMIS